MLSAINAGRTCEVCGAPATWESGLPEMAHLPARRQRFLCEPHHQAWRRFRIAPVQPMHRPMNFGLWQDEFDRFVEQAKGA